MSEPTKEQIDRERLEILEQLQAWLEAPMLVLGVVWLVLTVVDLTRGLNPVLDGANTVIWGVFILEFALRFTLAPRKLEFLKQNWLSAISLLVPALRVFRIARLVRVLRMARVARGLRLVRVLTSINRGMRALGSTMGRRGFGYVLALTALVIIVGAAGIYALESGAGGEAGVGLDSYGDALWWTAMLMTTLGSDYWPQSGEGRLLTFLLSLYAFAVFGYVTATIATFFIGRDASDRAYEVADTTSIEALREEIAALRAEIRAVSGGTTED
jgi:voltage-gated potassium channel